MGNSKVIYTCITGDYDILRQPVVTDPTWDYVCFSDKRELVSAGKSGVWQIRPLPSVSDSSLVRSRYPKLQPHKVLGEYEYSLWGDANIAILGDGLYREAERCIASGCDVAQVRHPFRDCVYEEMRTLEYQERLPMRVMLKEARFLRKEGFPRHAGQYENNLILRRHGAERVVDLSDSWWKVFLAFPYRDQVSLMYVYWKAGFVPGLLLPEGISARNAGFLRLYPHPNAPAKRRGLGIMAKRALKTVLRPVLYALLGL